MAEFNTQNVMRALSGIVDPRFTALAQQQLSQDERGNQAFKDRKVKGITFALQHIGKLSPEDQQKVLQGANDLGFNLPQGLNFGGPARQATAAKVQNEQAAKLKTGRLSALKAVMDNSSISPQQRTAVTRAYGLLSGVDFSGVEVGREIPKDTTTHTFDREGNAQLRPNAAQDAKAIADARRAPVTPQPLQKVSVQLNDERNARAGTFNSDDGEYSVLGDDGEMRPIAPGERATIVKQQSAQSGSFGGLSGRALGDARLKSNSYNTGLAMLEQIGAKFKEDPSFLGAGGSVRGVVQNSLDAASSLVAAVPGIGTQFNQIASNVGQLISGDASGLFDPALGQVDQVRNSLAFILARARTNQARVPVEVIKIALRDTAITGLFTGRQTADAGLGAIRAEVLAAKDSVDHILSGKPGNPPVRQMLGIPLSEAIGSAERLQSQQPTQPVAQAPQQQGQEPLFGMVNGVLQRKP